MSMWHSDITRVFVYIIHHYRCSFPKNWLKHTNPLYWPKMAKMFLDSRCCARNGSKIKYFLCGSEMSTLASHLWNEEKGSILSCGYLACSISNHLQQAL